MSAQPLGWLPKVNGTAEQPTSEPSVTECFAEARDRMSSAPAPEFELVDEPEWKGGLLRGRPVRGCPKGPILGILANAILALRLAPVWQGVLAFDEFAVRTITLKAAPWNPEPHPWTDTEDIWLTEWLQCNEICVSREITGQAVEAVSRERGFHPVKQYFDGLRWDGESLLNKWLERYLGVKVTDENRAYVSEVGMRTLIGAVARVYKPGCKFDNCLILEGPQGSRKSTAVRTLAPQWYADEIADLGSKDAAMQTRGVLIYELPELDAMNRTEASRIKAFMSRATDHFRPPYGKRVVDLPRQCIFVGTVNHSNYLRDETGGRRFWPVVCGLIDIPALERDRDQLWAEAVVRFQDGEPWWLQGIELNSAAAQQQADRYEGDAWDQLIIDFVEQRLASGCDSVSVPEVLDMCLGKKKDTWTRADEMRVSRCLRSRHWERYRDRKRGMEWRYRPTEAYVPKQ